MNSPALLRSSRIISDRPITDFDLVVVDGRLLAVCADFHGRNAFTWDPVIDRWNEHPLNSPVDPDEELEGHGLLHIGAVVLDGRIVVGGGGWDEQGFAQWDLATGVARTYIRDDDGGVARASSMVLDGRPLLACTDGSSSTVRLWDVSQRDAVTEFRTQGDDEFDGEVYYEVDYLAEPIELDAGDGFDSLVGLASGTLDGQPVVLSGGVDGRAIVWNARTREALTRFESAHVPIKGVGLVNAGGRPRVVAAGRGSLLLGDPRTATWDEHIEAFAPGLDDEGIGCVDAAVVDGRPIAVTGAGDGTMCLWDLEGGRLLGEPITEQELEVFAVRVIRLDGRAVALTAGRDGRMRVWSLDRR